MLLFLMMLILALNCNAVVEDDTIFIGGLESYQFPTGNNNTGYMPLMLPTAAGVIGIPERARKLFPEGYYLLRDVEYRDCTLSIKQEPVPITSTYIPEWVNSEQIFDTNRNLISEYYDIDGDFNWDNWHIYSYDGFNNLVNTKSYEVYTNSAGNNQNRIYAEEIYTYSYNVTIADRIETLSIEEKDYLYNADGTSNGSQSIIKSAEYFYYFGNTFDGLIKSEIWHFENIADVDINYLYDGNRNLIEYQIAPSTSPTPRQFIAFDYGSDMLIRNFRKGLKNYAGTTIISQENTEFSYLPISPFVSTFSDIGTRSSSTNLWTARQKVGFQSYANIANSSEPNSYCSGFEDYAWSNADFPISIKYGGYPYDPLQLCEEYQGDVDFKVIFGESCTR